MSCRRTREAWNMVVGWCCLLLATVVVKRVVPFVVDCLICCVVALVFLGEWVAFVLDKGPPATITTSSSWCRVMPKTRTKSSPAQIRLFLPSFVRGAARRCRFVLQLQRAVWMCRKERPADVDFSRTFFPAHPNCAKERPADVDFISTDRQTDQNTPTGIRHRQSIRKGRKTHKAVDRETCMQTNQQTWLSHSNSMRHP